MPALAQFFGKSGKMIDEIIVRAPRTWVLNGWGETKIIIGYDETKLQKNTIEVGNYVLIISDNPDIPVWGGIVEFPRKWTKNGLEITAYTGERIFKRRCSVQSNLVLKGTAGSIFAQIVQHANTIEHTRVFISPHIFTGGKERQESLNFSVLSDDIMRVSERSKNDWDVEPVLNESNNELSFEANWYFEKGETLNDIVLEEGKNIELRDDSSLIEGGVVANWVVGFGDGATWDEKPFTIKRNFESQDTYGLIMRPKEFSGNKNTSTLEQNTTTYLDGYAFPRNKNDVRVINDNDHVFQYIRNGNKFPIILHSFGFLPNTERQFGSSGFVRVIGFGYDEEDGKIDLVLEDTDDETEDTE